VLVAVTLRFRHSWPTVLRIRILPQQDRNALRQITLVIQCRLPVYPK
jgi:hypothetical protein